MAHLALPAQGTRTPWTPPVCSPGSGSGPNLPPSKSPKSQMRPLNRVGGGGFNGEDRWNPLSCKLGPFQLHEHGETSVHLPECLAPWQDIKAAFSTRISPRGSIAAPL